MVLVILNLQIIILKIRTGEIYAEHRNDSEGRY